MKATEQNFISLIKKKKEAGLIYVVEQYGWVIQSVVRRYLFSLPEEQEECINDVLLAVWESIGCFNPEVSTFANWLAGIARYKAIDHKRVYLKRLEQSFEEGVEPVDEASTAAFLRVEFKEEVAELLAALSDEDRKIFEEVYLECKPVAEVSEELHKKENYIYQRLSRGRKRLRLKRQEGGMGI